MNSGGEDRELRINGIQIHFHCCSDVLASRYRIFWSPAFFRGIFPRIRGSDIVHVHELRSMTSVSAYRAAARAHVPYVISPHGALKHLGKKLAKTAFDTLWGNRILAKAAALIAVSPVE
jgi:hypothetical protein